MLGLLCFACFLCHENVVDLDPGSPYEAVSSSHGIHANLVCGWRTFMDTWEGGGNGPKRGAINCLCMYICSCFDFYERELVDERQISATATTPWPV